MAPSASPLVVAGASGLLKLVRLDGATTWTFADGQPKAKPKPKPQTKMEQKKMEFNHDAAYGECVGTLRWSEKSSFPVLAAWPLPAGAPPPKLTGWRAYLEMRLAADASGTIKVEPPMLDGLSYPLSLVFALQRLNLTPPTPGPLSVLIVGASRGIGRDLARAYASAGRRDSPPLLPHNWR